MRDRSIEYQKTNQKRKLWLSNGLCRECGNNLTAKSNLCDKCYFIRISAKRLGTGKKWTLIKNLLLLQNSICALTGDCLTFDNMELDHIIPTSKGGPNDIGNVRWVTKEANRMKQDKSDNELIELCKKILTNLSL